MALVLEEKLGNTVIRVHDDCCRDEEETQRILRRAALAAKAALSKAGKKNVPK